LKEIHRLASACLAAVGGASAGAIGRAAKTRVLHGVSKPASVPDFAAQIRHFTNEHSKGMNGQQKFTLLIAYFAKGKLKTEIPLETIRDAWSGMKGLLGKFNTGYAVWAKDNGWVDSPKAKVYVLLPGWTEILDRHG
jgi:hypothetical protein